MSGDFQVSFGGVVRGFHIYWEIWSPILGEDPEDCYAMRFGSIIGHNIPWEISKTCFHFISHGEIGCKITGTRQRSLLLEGGLEVPCVIDYYIIWYAYVETCQQAYNHLEVHINDITYSYDQFSYTYTLIILHTCNNFVITGHNIRSHACSVHQLEVRYCMIIIHNDH